MSRSVIDVNRDPSGISLYPGMATTELCPTMTFDGEPLYRGEAPIAEEVAERRELYFEPYHTALRRESGRLREKHSRIVLYDCHSIRSLIPRLFEGELPAFNFGTNSGASADPALIGAVVEKLAASGQSFVVDGRFKGGWITRHYGKPDEGVHALQMELACRAYVREPGSVSPHNWPPLYEPAYAAATRGTLEGIFAMILAWIG